MKFVDRILGVRSLDAGEARAWMDGRSAGSYTLLDVREPEEYEQVGHLPGAVLMPLSELPERLAELARAKPILAY